MGWTCGALHGPFSSRAAIAFDLGDEFAGRVMATARYGTVIYAAVRSADRTEAFGLVLLAERRDGVLCTKPVSEDMGPAEDRCPARILDLLSEPSNEYARDWRERCRATSSAGAEGWMAFLPSTFEEWGVDGDGDGVKDIFDPADAIYSAANYLHDSGAPGDWSKAVFAYNHADWYVEKVLRYARRFSDGEEVQTGSACAAAAVAPNEAVGRMVAEAERLSILRPHTEYVWGGSHGETPTPADGPFDCSSAVSHLLQVGGFDNPTMDTIALMGWGEPGPGRWVTIFDKPYGEEAHTFIRFSAEVTPASERYWGTSGFVEPGHGPGWIPESTFSAGYLAGFMQRHPPGL